MDYFSARLPAFTCPPQQQDLSAVQPSLSLEEQQQQELQQQPAHDGRARRLSIGQVRVLEKAFQDNPKPSAYLRQQLADGVGAHSLVIQVCPSQDAFPSDF